MFENTDNLLLYEFSLSHKITTEFLVNTTKFLTWFWMNCWKYPSIAKIPLYQEYLDRLAASSEALPCWASLTLYWRFQLSLFRRITSFLMSGNSPVFDSDLLRFVMIAWCILHYIWCNLCYACCMMQPALCMMHLATVMVDLELCKQNKKNWRYWCA